MITMVKGHTTGGERIRLIECSQILPNPLRPRGEIADRSLISLADSIHRHGILVPLTVCPAAEGNGYILISGERRLRAAEMLGMQEVPCIVLPHNGSLCAEFAVIESLQKQELNIFEQAESIERLITACSLTREEAARRLSCSPSYIANKLRLLRLDEKERRIIIERGLSERHARALLRISDPEERMNAMKEIADSTMTVAAAEEMIERRVANMVNKSADRSGSSEFTEHEKKGSPTTARTNRTIRDITPFMNTVMRALRSLELAGVHTELSRTDGNDWTELRIRIPIKRS